MITIYAMGKKGLGVLTHILPAFGKELITAVVSSRDGNVQKDYYEEIRDICLQHNVPFFDRKGYAARKTEYAMAIAWRWLIAEADRLIVFHDSLLPKYRGFNPLVTALINGDEEIGVTALWATGNYDEGDIIFQSRRKIAYPVKISTAIDLISEDYAGLASQICSHLRAGQALPATQQVHVEATYSMWRDEEDYSITWRHSSEEIKRFIDAVGFPYKGAVAHIGNKKIIVEDAEVADDVPIANRTPGKVFQLTHEGPLVVCGTGILHVKKMVDEEGSDFHLPNLRVRFN